MTDWSEERPTIELVKETITVPEVAELLGLEANEQDKITSPFNQDERTPSCHLYEDHWYDYSAGKGGDVVDLVRVFYPDMSVPRAVKLIWNRALRAGREPGDVERQPVRQVQDFSQQLAGLTLDPAIIQGWSEKLGVPIPGNCRHQATVDLLIPHEDQDGVYGVRVRHQDDSKESWLGSQFTKRLYDPFGWGEGYGAIGGECVITEGETDCWALQSVLHNDDGAWPPVFALPSGAQSWKDSWLEDLEPFDKVWLCLDNDDAGNKAREKLTRKIGYLKVEQLRVPPLYNDARKAIAAGWRPEL